MSYRWCDRWSLMRGDAMIAFSPVSILFRHKREREREGRSFLLPLNRNLLDAGRKRQHRSTTTPTDSLLHHLLSPALTLIVFAFFPPSTLLILVPHIYSKGASHEIKLHVSTSNFRSQSIITLFSVTWKKKLTAAAEEKKFHENSITPGVSNLLFLSPLFQSLYTRDRHGLLTTDCSYSCTNDRTRVREREGYGRGVERGSRKRHRYY